MSPLAAARPLPDRRLRRRVRGPRRVRVQAARAGRPRPRRSRAPIRTRWSKASRGRVERFKSSHQDVSVEYDRQLTYADGSTKLARRARRHRGEGTARAPSPSPRKKGQVGKGESDDRAHRRRDAGGERRPDRDDRARDLRGRATAIVRAPGPVNFSRGRLSGAGVGMTYDKNRDALTILRPGGRAHGARRPRRRRHGRHLGHRRRGAAREDAAVRRRRPRRARRPGHRGRRRRSPI